ncbi:ABC transporter permease [Cellulomonas bogoriensis]|uniref:ABC transporter n=1 Tax=Cellulomonas bogoriensis 69B4 = DSM 16987 TaxID=1386082 RepID=A0A0A0BYX4_9CELL|nr:ABC transporter permease [Cellulomonas bogoriensis]KGM13121.1 ABC transporter [Cellulomonas bogoriensis 69B4 = DSM 16987]
MSTADTLTLPPARRLPATAWGHLLLTETRMVVRDTSGLIVPIGFPALLMVMNGLGASGQQQLPSGVTVMNGIIMPLTLTMVVALIGVVNMPSFLATYRKYGILRGLAVTPARPVMILTAQMLVSLAQVLLGVGLMMAVGAAFFGVTLPQHLPWALLTGTLLIAAMYGIGTLIAAVAPTVNAGLALGLVAFFAMLAVGGGFGPTAELPTVLRTIGELLPYGAGTEALAATWAGEAPQGRDLAVLGGWAAVTGGLAARLFRWT